MQWNQFFLLKYSKCEQVNKKRWRLEINNFSFKWFNANLRHYLDWNYLAGHRSDLANIISKNFWRCLKCLSDALTRLERLFEMSLVYPLSPMSLSGAAEIGHRIDRVRRRNTDPGEKETLLKSWIFFNVNYIKAFERFFLIL